MGVSVTRTGTMRFHGTPFRVFYTEELSKFCPQARRGGRDLIYKRGLVISAKEINISTKETYVSDKTDLRKPQGRL